jgi:ABC-2 type transport system ATP-binding protein
LNVESASGHKKVHGFDMKVIDDSTVEVDLTQKQTMSHLIHELHEHGYVVRDIRPKGNRLEQLFLNILQHK